MGCHRRSKMLAVECTAKCLHAVHQQLYLWWLLLAGKCVFGGGRPSSKGVRSYCLPVRGCRFGRLRVSTLSYLPPSPLSVLHHKLATPICHVACFNLIHILISPLLPRFASLAGSACVEPEGPDPAHGGAGLRADAGADVPEGVQLEAHAGGARGGAGDLRQDGAFVACHVMSC